MAWAYVLISNVARHNAQEEVLDNPNIFMVINNSLTHDAVVSRTLIIASPSVEVANATVPSGERFYDIPVDDIEFVILLAKP